jgi:hypothetical protein
VSHHSGIIFASRLSLYVCNMGRRKISGDEMVY